MKIELINNNLITAVANAERLTGKNLSLPILQTILFEVVDGNLFIKSTNLESSFNQKIKAKTGNNGRIAVEARLLLSFLNNLNKDEKIVIEFNNNNLIIKTNEIKSVIKGQFSDEFPIIPKVSGKSFLIENNNLINGFKSVIYAGSVSNIKPEITSIYLYSNNNNKIFVSTDSFRLAEKTIYSKDEDNLNVIIPLKPCFEIIKIFEDLNEVIKITTNQNQISIKGGDIEFTTQLINGVYPDYQQIIPKEFKTKILINKEVLLSYLKSASIFSDKFYQISIKFNKRNILIIESKNQDYGEYFAQFEVEMSGEEGDVSLNAKYLIDGLQAITKDSINFIFNGKNKPILIQGVGDQSFNYLIMPVVR